jgi:hypothetical protein
MIGVLLAGVHGQAAFDLQLIPCVLDNIPHALDLSSATREHEIAVALGTICPPLLERVDDDGGEGNIALSSFRLGGPMLPQASAR